MATCVLMPCFFVFGWYDKGTNFSMGHGFEGQEIFTDGVQPEDVQRIEPEGIKDDWDAVRKHFDSTVEKGDPWNTIHGEPPEIV